jgi:hypothetical protein
MTRGFGLGGLAGGLPAAPTSNEEWAAGILPKIAITSRKSHMPGKPKQEKQEKTKQSTAEFVESINRKDEQRNGRRIRFGFTKRAR